MPAAPAICRLVTRSPCSSSSGSVAATIIARRSSGARAGARFVFVAIAGTVTTPHDSGVSPHSYMERGSGQGYRQLREAAEHNPAVPNGRVGGEGDARGGADERRERDRT